ncbi:outer membrane protein transport protein [Phocaeicola coprocola]|uniref:outer membrane protein transport protein n=1 Tax=Phocaeicola coprocola TaxID=310298 RepID=UPI00266BE5BD|nr:outer membrane protein transport protein [Phocaeicola coprocola]
MKKKIMVLTVAGALASAAAAQNQYDALRFLGNDVNGTARFVGMGGAMSSLGADLSTIGTNPAGIGLYRSNDVALSFGFNANKSHSDFNGSVMDESRNRASFDQVGFVWSTKIGNKTDLRFLNFAFNYHKRVNFNRQFASKGGLNGNSLTWQMADMIDGAEDGNGGLFYQSEDDFYGSNGLLNADNPYMDRKYVGTPYLGAMGARTGLVDVKGDKDGNITDIYGWNGIDGEYYSRETGSVNEYDFNVSFNVRDRFYFGATLGVYDIDYLRYSSYGENMQRLNGEYQGNFTLNNTYKTEGTGIDLKVGTIIRPFEYSPFRFGLAIHTPILYNMSDRYTSVLTSNLPSASYTENLADYLYGGQYAWDYRLITPWRFNVSVGTIVGGIMALDAEYEFENYSATKLQNAEGVELNGQSAVKETLKGVHSFRVGMETKVSSAFSVRAGYHFRSTPITSDAFKNIPVTDNTRTDAEYLNLKSRQAVSVGLGYRGRLVYADVAYKYDFYKGDFYAFDGGIDQSGNLLLSPTKVNNERHQLLFTVGVHF